MDSITSKVYDASEVFAKTEAKVLRRAARAAPQHPSTHLHLGSAFEAMGMLDSARVEYSTAVELKPGEVRLRFALATALQKLGMYEAAFAQYDTMLELNPDNPLVHHNLAVALFQTGQLERAWTELQEAKRLGGPVNPNLERALSERIGRAP